MGARQSYQTELETLDVDENTEEFRPGYNILENSNYLPRSSHSITSQPTNVSNCVENTVIHGNSSSSPFPLTSNNNRQISNSNRGINQNLNENNDGFRCSLRSSNRTSFLHSLTDVALGRINHTPSSNEFNNRDRHSVPFLHLIGHDIKCPMCHKKISSDDAEIHLVMCITKPRISYNEDVLNVDRGECSICFDEMLAGSTIARLPCLCIYHKNCIDEWFKRKNCCPEHPGEN